MVAPLDAKVTFEVEGDPVTLRLNFRSIALAEESGIDLLGGTLTDLSPSKSAVLVKCLAVQEHPDFTEDHTMAIVARAPDALRGALIELFSKYASPPSAEGNAKPRRRARKKVT
jgi:hypothetical protein